MTVQKVYVNTHRYDIKWTRICIASLRYWYPDIPIFLIVDYSNGSLPARKMLRKWNLQILDTGRQHYGWGFGKFEPLFLNDHHHFLVLDADTVITGPVLDKVKDLQSDFVVDQEVQPLEKLQTLYYDPVEVTSLFPGFEYPGYSFNTGQWIGKGDVLTKEDFNDFVSWDPKPALKHPSYFKQADQGILNLLVHIKERKQQLFVSRIPLMIWPVDGNADFIQLSDIERKKGPNSFVIHWAGIKFRHINEYPRADILKFYERYYYSKYGVFEKLKDRFLDQYLLIERKFSLKLSQLRSSEKK